MKTIIIILLTIIMSSCYLDDYETIDIEFDYFIHMVVWIKNNIDHKLDFIEEWQSPEETYRKRTGDCEDVAFLASYFLKKLNIEHDIMIGQNIESNDFHAYIYLIERDRYYDPQYGKWYTVEDYSTMITYIFTLHKFQL